jgi:ABC-type transport system involved in multi-copper enzyme maturation permease subunit
VSSVSIVSSARSEWIKFRTVRSTLYNVLAIVVLTIGIGALVAYAIQHRYHDLSGARKATFDPLSSSLAGLFFAQFVIGVLGSMLITSEYATGTIRTTIAAVPKRLTVVAGKALVVAASVIVIGEAISFAAFEIGQAIFRAGDGVPHVSLSTPGALRGVLLAGVFLTLLAILGFGLGLILRKTAAAIVVFVVVLLVVPIILAVIPSDIGTPILRYMPSQLGSGMMSINHDPTTFYPLGSTLLMVAYAAGMVAIGSVLFVRRDA